MGNVYVGDISKEKLLCAMFNNSIPANPHNKFEMTEEKAKELLEEKKGYIGYHEGRRIETDFSKMAKSKLVNMAKYDDDYYYGPMVKSGAEVVQEVRFEQRQEARKAKTPAVLSA